MSDSTPLSPRQPPSFAAKLPPQFRFLLNWRPYQQRVLEEFERHLDDRHFHIAAAPGAGKTVLGLEALRRLGQPAVVLAPTSAIRDQWLSRLRELFLPKGAACDWLSDDLKQPGLLTVDTYQALYSLQRRTGITELIERLLAQGVQTLVLDEAHHLRQQWWRSLLALKRGLQRGEHAPWLIALTATPPYDVSQQEWNRYIELCGPLDAEVAVPELVKAGNLCPHQDYIYFSRPEPVEAERLQRFEREIGSLITDIYLDREWIDWLALHPWVVNPREHTDLLAKHSDFALSLLLMLSQVAAERCRELLHCLGLAEVKLPLLHPGWLEILLNGLLFSSVLRPNPLPTVLHRLQQRLRQIGAIERRQVYCRAPPRLISVLEKSASKCRAVAEVIELESRQLGLQLRAVVLCDLIREQGFPSPSISAPVAHGLGVVPVFEELRKRRLADVELGILTGSLVVIPVAAMPTLGAIAADCGVDTDQLKSQPLWQAADFLQISVSGIENSVLLAMMTRLFERGQITVLVGTAALLGEGWDAPAINTLVLASAVRTSMRSNQMRGRAIRVQAGNPNKSANIWHLACLLPAAEGDPHAPPMGADMAMLSQRFGSFAGIDWQAATIENGIQRLGIDPAQCRTQSIDQLNARMCRAAGDRLTMRQRWRAALEDRSTTPKRLVLQTRVPLRRIVIGARFAHSLAFERLAPLRWLRGLWLRRQLQLLADGLLQALYQQSLIGSASTRVEVSLAERSIGARLEGGSTHEESLFASCLRELFDLPESPRYLLQRGAGLYAVPACLGARKADAECLLRNVSGRFRRAQLIFTRSQAGRLVLLQARERWLATRFDPGCESRMLWA